MCCIFRPACLNATESRNNFQFRAAGSNSVGLLFFLRMCLVGARIASSHYTVMAVTTYSHQTIHLPPPLLPSLLPLLLLLLSGDVETNPGPPTGRMSVAKGPSTEEQVYTLNAQVNSPCFLDIFNNMLEIS